MYNRYLLHTEDAINTAVSSSLLLFHFDLYRTVLVNTEYKAWNDKQLESLSDVILRHDILLVCGVL